MQGAGLQRHVERGNIAPEITVVHAPDAVNERVVAEEHHFFLDHLDHDIAVGVCLAVVIDTKVRAVEDKGFAVLDMHVRHHRARTAYRIVSHGVKQRYPVLAVGRGFGFHFRVGINHSLGVGRLDGLITEPVVAVNVGIEHRDHRVFSDLGDFLQHQFANLHARTGIYHHHALLRQHETGVVHETPVDLVWQLIRAMEDIDPFGELGEFVLARDRRRLGRAAGDKRERDNGKDGGWTHAQDPVWKCRQYSDRGWRG